MGRRPSNREAHARMVDEWLALPIPRPPLGRFIREKGYRVTQRSLQQELERRGLNRITGEPEPKHEEPEMTQEPREVTETETEMKPGREKMSGEQVISTAVDSVDEVEEPTPPPAPEPEPPKEESKPAEKPDPKLKTNWALGMLGFGLITALLVIIGKGSGLRGQAGERAERTNHIAIDGGGNGGYRPYQGAGGDPTRYFRTIDDL